MAQLVFRRLVAAAVAGACVTVAALAQPGSASKPAEGPLPPTVEKTMEAVDDTMDRLSKQIGTPGALETIWELERLALHAKSMVPEHLKGGPGSENVTGYRKAQVELMRLLLNAETAILDNKPDDARKSLDDIDNLRKEAHRKFKGKKAR
jgi:soluble cytochrome b562